MAHYRRERSFLRSLCKGHIQELIEDVGWSHFQCVLVKKRYLEFKSVPMICMETHITPTTLNRHFIDIFKKLESYLIHNRETEIGTLYRDFR